MSKTYEIQAKFGKSWVTIEKTNLHNDALHYVKEHAGESYPMRVVRIVKTIIFNPSEK